MHPERFTRTFRPEVVRCRKTIGDEAVPEIRLHDLRHTHATLLLAKGVPVKVVSERLGHASATITLQVYAHVMPGNQRDAAELFASLIKGECMMSRPETSERHHGPFPAGRVPLSPARMWCPRGDLNPHALYGH